LSVSQQRQIAFALLSIVLLKMKEAGLFLILSAQFQTLLSRFQAVVMVESQKISLKCDFWSCGGRGFELHEGSLFEALSLSRKVLNQYVSLHMMLRSLVRQHWSYVLVTFIGMGIHVGVGKRVLSFHSKIYRQFKHSLRSCPMGVIEQHSDSEVFPPIPSPDGGYSKKYEYQIPKAFEGVCLDRKECNPLKRFYMAPWGAKVIEWDAESTLKKVNAIRLNVLRSHVAFF
jgi:hypothetical protein